MSKPSAVMVPLMLLLLDVWPLGRPAAASATTAPAGDVTAGDVTAGDVTTNDVTADDAPGGDAVIHYASVSGPSSIARPAGRYWGERVAEKLPLLALSAAAAVVAIRGQGSLALLTHLPLSTRLANAVVSVANYLRQTVWPTGLVPFYPHPATAPTPTPVWVVLGATVLVLALTAGAAAAFRRRPYLLVGWLWFLGVLVPNLGLLQAGDQARADRFTLLPSIGLIVAVVWLAADWVSARPSASDRRVWSTAATALAAAAAVALTVATSRLLSNWRDMHAIWTYTVAVSPHNYMAESLLSQEYTLHGNPVAGERLARQAIADNPAAKNIYAGLAQALASQPNRTKEANAAFYTAIVADPSNMVLRVLAGDYLRLTHRDADAASQYRFVIRHDPSVVDARAGLVKVLLETRDYPAAAQQLAEWLSLFPHDAEAEGLRGDTLVATGDQMSARSAWAAAIADGSSDWNVQTHLAWAVDQDPASGPGELTQAAALAKAASDQTAAAQPFPLFAQSAALARLDQFDAATATGEQALAAARKTGQTAMADGIAAYLSAYRRGLAFPPRPATRPTTRPATTRAVMGPSTRA